MSKYLYILKNTVYFIFSLIIYLLLVSFLSIVDVISYKTISIISFIFTILLFMYFGLKLAKKSNHKGYLIGLVSSAVNMLFFLLILLITKESIKPATLIYYSILLIAGLVGGMLGVNLKKTD